VQETTRFEDENVYHEDTDLLPDIPGRRFFVYFQGASSGHSERKIPVLDRPSVDGTLTRVAHGILEQNKGARSLGFIGVQRGGVYLTKRLAEKIKIIEGVEVRSAASISPGTTTILPGRSSSSISGRAGCYALFITEHGLLPW
jgi:hypothetical protein